MTIALSLPRPEDFGLDEDALRRSPRPWVAEHQGALLVGAVVVLTAVVGVIVALDTGSFAAAAFFAPVTMIASLILVVPLLVAVCSALGRAEARWRRARRPEAARCDSYLEALEGYRRALRQGLAAEAEGALATTRARREGPSRPPAPRRRCPPAALNGEEVRALGTIDLVELAHGDPGVLGSLVALVGEDRAVAVDRSAVGADLLVVGERKVLVRVERPGESATLATARELAMAVVDAAADEGVLIAPAATDHVLARYAAAHALRLVGRSGGD